MKKVRSILLGHGHLGKWHAQKLSNSSQCEFVGIVEPNTYLHSELQKIYPNVEIKKSLEEITTGFEAAVVASPTSFHFDICQKLLAMDKNVFCEKPVTETFEQAQALLKTNRTKVFQVGHSERFHAFFSPENLAEVESYLAGPVHLRLERQAPFKGRATDVDVVSDLMIHDIDLLLYLTGEKPTSVRAKGFKVLTNKWDVVEALFTFKSGKTASILVGRTYVKEVRYLESIGPLGTLHFDLKDEKRSIFAKNLELVQKDFERRDHLLIEQQKFFESIANQSGEVVTLDDGANAVYLVTKTIEALESGEELAL